MTRIGPYKFEDLRRPPLCPILRATTERQADKGRSERMFAVGDWVHLKLQPYVQASAALRSHQNCHSNSLVLPSYPACGLGSIQVAVTRLDKDPSSGACVSSEACSWFWMCGITLTAHWQLPVQCAGKNSSASHHDMTPCTQVLVQWSHMPLALTTWEDDAAAISASSCLGSTSFSSKGDVSTAEQPALSQCCCRTRDRGKQAKALQQAHDKEYQCSRPNLDQRAAKWRNKS
jgi:hypothetical protein